MLGDAGNTETFRHVVIQTSVLILRRIRIYSGVIVNNHGPETQIYVTPNPMVFCGNSFAGCFVVLQNKDSHKSRQFKNALVGTSERPVQEDGRAIL